ncbi:MAG: hypothetical protein QOD50_384, partial [Actinomycetota bacterium]|nr:hypothetical protein [Actinomycetota bacterium]
EADKAFARSAEGTPIHAQDRHSSSDGPVRFTAPSVIFERDDARADVGGFQPFESYDNALANLAPELERRPAPSDPAAALSALPDGLTTAELALVMRPTDLAEADIAETSRRLIELAHADTVTGEPVGTDVLWRLAR